MDSTKKSNESEMGSGDSDDEFYNVKLPYTPEVAHDKSAKKVQVKKVYSPPRTKVQYNYEFDSSSDEESEVKSHQKDSQSQSKECSENSKKSSEKKDESSKEKANLSQSTCKVVEKINEELRSMKNSGQKPQNEKSESLTGQNHIATSVPTTVSVARPPISVVPPVVVVPPPMVVPQASIMGPMIVPSAISMGGPMAMMGNMIRGPNPMGLPSNAISNSMMGMNAVPGMMGMQGNIMGMAGGMINPAAMGSLNMGMPGSMIRMPGAGNAMFRMQGASGNMLGANNMIGISRPNSSIVGVPRTVSMPATAGNLMVNNPMIGNPGGLMVMGGMMSNPGGIMNNSVAGVTQTTAGNLVGSSNMVRMVNSPQGNLPIRVPPPPPFLNFRGRPPVPPGNFRWQANTKVQSNIPKAGSPTSPSASSPSSSPLDKSSRDYDGDEFRDDKEKSPSFDTDESQSPPRELPNTFKNDGSFMEMFKKMTEESESNQEASSSNEKNSGNSEGTDSTSTLKRPQVMLSGIVGKRRGGRVLKTGLVKKVKKGGEAEEEKHPKDAWSMYMAEVKKYREASCEEEGKTRPQPKSIEAMAKTDISLSTIPVDPRFPNTNQSKNCYQNYLDFHKCAKKRGENFESCLYFKKAYKTLCPKFWVEKWDSQVEEGTFAGQIN